MAQIVKNLPAVQETWVRSLGQEDPLEKGMATPVLLPGEFHGRKSLESYSPRGHKRVGHDWATNTFTFRGSSEGKPWGHCCFRRPRVITRVQGPARGWRWATSDGGVRRAGQGEARGSLPQGPVSAATSGLWKKNDKIRDLFFSTKNLWGFPGGPVVKTLPSNAGGAGSIPSQGAKTTPWLMVKNTDHKQQKQYCKQFNKDFKNGPHKKYLKTKEFI